jgi:hypothetical protein
MALPPLVEDVMAAYSDAVDAEVPGLLEGLYLVGSAVLDDFRPRTSDVDFVAVTAARLERPALAGLRRAHARVHRRWQRPTWTASTSRGTSSGMIRRGPDHAHKATKGAFTASAAVREIP